MVWSRGGRSEMFKRAFVILLISTFVFAQEKVDTAMIAKIRAEGLNQSRVMEVFDHLVNVIGPRLTASPSYRAAVEWTRQRLENMGVDNVHLEPWQLGRGWELERLTVEMLEPRYAPLIGYAKGWSPSTNGRVSGSPVWLGIPADKPEKYAVKLTGSIVMTAPIQEDFVRDDRSPASGDFRRQSLLSAAVVDAQRQRTQAGAEVLRKERPAIELEPNLGEHGTVFVTGRDN